MVFRFTSSSVKYNVSTYLLEIVTEQLNRRQPVDNISRNLLRLLMATCGHPQVRLLVSQRIEVWLQNPKVYIFILNYLMVVVIMMIITMILMTVDIIILYFS